MTTQERETKVTLKGYRLFVGEWIGNAWAVWCADTEGVESIDEKPGSPFRLYRALELYAADELLTSEPISGFDTFEEGIEFWEGEWDCIEKPIFNQDWQEVID